jgi:hypothetical protein
MPEKNDDHQQPESTGPDTFGENSREWTVWRFTLRKHVLNLIRCLEGHETIGLGTGGKDSAEEALHDLQLVLDGTANAEACLVEIPRSERTEKIWTAIKIVQQILTGARARAGSLIDAGAGAAAVSGCVREAFLLAHKETASSLSRLAAEITTSDVGSELSQFNRAAEEILAEIKLADLRGSSIDMTGKEFSKPMSFPEIAEALGISTARLRKMKDWPFEMKDINRQEWIINLAGMPAEIRAKLV